MLEKGLRLALVIGEREFFALLAFKFLFWCFLFVILSVDSYPLSEYSLIDFPIEGFAFAVFIV
jgi:hypothetical protein